MTQVYSPIISVNEGFICHEQCDSMTSCWGSSDTQCQGCRNFRYLRRCVQDCSVVSLPANSRWGRGRVRVWLCESVVVWECGRVRVWLCESVVMWSCESVRVWEWSCESVRVWDKIVCVLMDHLLTSCSWKNALDLMHALNQYPALWGRECGCVRVWECGQARSQDFLKGGYVDV